MNGAKCTSTTLVPLSMLSRNSYEAALKTDQFLLIVHGTAAEVATAKGIIGTTHPVQLSMHSGEAKAMAV
jgi:hypothetical protein